MMVVSKSAMMPETALAAVMQAWVPLLPACSADSTMDTCKTRSMVYGDMDGGFKLAIFRNQNPLSSDLHCACASSKCSFILPPHGMFTGGD